MVADGTAARAARASSTVATKNVLQPAAASARATGSTPQPYASALITAAHSAGTAAFSSLRQFATMALRSTVSTPVAAASAAAWFASGERMVLAGIDFGSETRFMLRLYAAEQGGSTVQPGSNRCAPADGCPALDRRTASGWLRIAARRCRWGRAAACR